MARATGLEPAASGVTGRNYASNINAIDNKSSEESGANTHKVPGRSSTPKRQIFTRQELYDLVWSVPMMRLAARFEVSGRGLAKICQRAHIPVPKPGYWAKVQAGQPMAKVPLPAAVIDAPTRVIVKSSAS
jgi:hypothetical protein